MYIIQKESSNIDSKSIILVDGVEYNELSTAEKINIAFDIVDIIKTLS